MKNETAQEVAGAEDNKSIHTASETKAKKAEATAANATKLAPKVSKTGVAKKTPKAEKENTTSESTPLSATSSTPAKAKKNKQLSAAAKKKLAKEKAEKAEEASLEPIDKLEIPTMTLPKITEPDKDMKLVGVVNRSGVKMINPRELVINWKGGHQGRNPRINFGSPEKWAAWQKDIAVNGFGEPIIIYRDKEDGRHYLRHGYRRMKAMLEVLALNDPKFNFDLVPVVVTEKDEVAELKDHFTLNSYEPLGEIEQAEGLRRYIKLTGQKKIKQVARQLGLEYVKAINLYKFIKAAHADVVKAVNEGKITFSGAKVIVKKAKTPAEQAEMIKIGAKNAKGTKTGKIRTSHHVPAIKAEVDGKAPLDVKIFNILDKAAADKNVDSEFLTRMLNVLNAIRDSKNDGEIFEMLAPIALAS